MQRQTDLVVTRFSTCFCAPQVLVIDRYQGPAHILVDTLSLLLDHEVSVTTVEEHDDALRALDYYHFDLVVVGLEEQRSLQLTILPHIQRERPGLPVIVVGRDLPPLYRQYARNYGAREVLNMPERAIDLKRLLACVADQYLPIA
jgi:DNA-binding NtrC family response regulator